MRYGQVAAQRIDPKLAMTVRAQSPLQRSPVRRRDHISIRSGPWAGGFSACLAWSRSSAARHRGFGVSYFHSDTASGNAGIVAAPMPTRNDGCLMFICSSLLATAAFN